MRSISRLRLRARRFACLAAVLAAGFASLAGAACTATTCCSTSTPMPRPAASRRLRAAPSAASTASSARRSSPAPPRPRSPRWRCATVSGVHSARPRSSPRRARRSRSASASSGRARSSSTTRWPRCLPEQRRFGVGVASTAADGSTDALVPLVTLTLAAAPPAGAAAPIPALAGPALMLLGLALRRAGRGGAAATARTPRRGASAGRPGAARHARRDEHG